MTHRCICPPIDHKQEPMKIARIIWLIIQLYLLLLKEVYVSKLSCQPEPMKLEVLESGETTAVITEL